MQQLRHFTLTSSRLLCYGKWMVVIMKDEFGAQDSSLHRFHRVIVFLQGSYSSISSDRVNPFNISTLAAPITPVMRLISARSSGRIPILPFFQLSALHIVWTIVLLLNQWTWMSNRTLLIACLIKKLFWERSSLLAGKQWYNILLDMDIWLGAIRQSCETFLFVCSFQLFPPSDLSLY